VSVPDRQYEKMSSNHKSSLIHARPLGVRRHAWAATLGTQACIEEVGDGFLFKGVGANCRPTTIPYVSILEKGICIPSAKAKYYS
jgi:hypothetical protein